MIEVLVATKLKGGGQKRRVNRHTERARKVRRNQ